MDALTILMIAHNELPYAKVAVDSIRKLGDIEGLELILVDNASSDGLREWAQQQEDFTYVWMEQGMEPYGKIVNEVRRELGLSEDLLVHHKINNWPNNIFCAILNIRKRGIRYGKCKSNYFN